MVSKNFKILLIFLLVAVYVILCLTSTNIIIDDSYITFQYAKNFSEFGKPWYNLDPSYQGNGQTSLLWMWMLALLNFFGWKPEFSFLWLNLFLGIFLIYKLIQNLEFKKDQLVLSFFNFSLACFFVYWLYLNSLHGLETVLAAFVLYLFVKNWDQSFNYFAILLLLIRPEYGLFLLFWTLDSKIFSHQFFRRILFSAIGGLIFVIYYLVYFDYYIPLPFIYKSELGTYDFQHLSVYLGLLLIFLPVFGTLFQRKKYLLLIPFNIFIFYYTFNVQSYSSGIFNRYYFPLLSLYLVYPVIIPQIERIKFSKYIVYAIWIFAVLRMLDLSGNFYRLKKDIITYNPLTYGAYQKLVDLTKEDQPIMVCDAGYTAYFSKTICYDGFGLNDAKLLIAKKSRDSAQYRQYLMDKKVIFIGVASKSLGSLEPRFEAEGFIHQSLGLTKIKPSKIFPMEEGYHLFVYKFEKGYPNN